MSQKTVIPSNVPTGTSSDGPISDQSNGLSDDAPNGSPGGSTDRVQDKAGKRSAYHHGDLRAQLLLAVRALVEEKGAENFSIAEAARKAGVSSAAPYRHFKDKPEILKAVVLDAMEGMANTMHEAMAPHPPGSLARIDALGRCYINFARNHTGMFRLVFGISESHKDDDELSKRGGTVFGIVVAAVADYLGIAKDAPDAHMRAYMLWSFVHGHSWLTIDEKGKQANVELSEADLLAAISTSVLLHHKQAS